MLTKMITSYIAVRTVNSCALSGKELGNMYYLIHARRAVAKRNYPTSEVRGSSGRECQAATAQERPGEELPHVRGQGRRLEGATPPR